MWAPALALSLLLFCAAELHAAPAPGPDATLAQTQEASLPADRRLAVGRRSRGAGQESWQTYLLHDRPILTDANLREAEVNINQQSGSPEVALTFDRAGTEAFAQFTADHIGSRLAIVLDDEVMSAPVIMSAIPGGRAVISLGASGSRPEAVREAELLAATLSSHALPCPVTPVSENTAEIGLRLELRLDLEKAARDRTRALGWQLRDALTQARIPFEEIRVLGPDQLRVQLAAAVQAEGVALALATLPGPFALETRRDPAHPRRVSIGQPPAKRARLEDLARAQTVRILDQRLAQAGVRGHRIRVAAPDRLIVDLPAVPFPEQIKRLVLKRSHLEFLAVDDENDLHLRQRHQLPAGIRLEFYSFHGPAQWGPRQTSFWVSDGPEGRSRLRAFIRSLKPSPSGD